LPFEHDLPVVNPPGGVHDAVGVDYLLAGKPLLTLTRILNIFIGYRGRLRIRFGCRHPVPPLAEQRVPSCIVNRGQGFRIYWIYRTALTLRGRGILTVEYGEAAEVDLCFNLA